MRYSTFTFCNSRIRGYMDAKNRPVKSRRSAREVSFLRQIIQESKNRKLGIISFLAVTLLLDFGLSGRARCRSCQLAATSNLFQPTRMKGWRR